MDWLLWLNVNGLVDEEKDIKTDIFDKIFSGLGNNYNIIYKIFGQE